MGSPRRASRAGFTLAEAAITIALVALTLSTMLQILQGSKFTTAHTRDLRIARDLALQRLGEIESGLWWDEIDTGRVGNFADLDQPDFSWELTVGDERFADVPQDEEGKPFDNWAYREELRREQEEEAGLDEDDEEEVQTEPFEKVRIKVTFPKYGDLQNEIVLERWIRWEQVYGVSEEEEAEAAAGGDGPASDPPDEGGDSDG